MAIATTYAGMLGEVYAGNLGRWIPPTRALLLGRRIALAASGCSTPPGNDFLHCLSLECAIRASVVMGSASAPAALWPADRPVAAGCSPAARLPASC
ncbi:hypothetical protein ACPA9J_31625 [Pseudomonas aeruginosa]